MKIKIAIFMYIVNFKMIIQFVYFGNFMYFKLILDSTCFFFKKKTIFMHLINYINCVIESFQFKILH